MAKLKARKYYAVKEGKETGIFRTWEECKENVIGVTGAVYKSFLTEEEALEFMNGVNKENEKALTNVNSLQAYVDGSFSEGYRHYAYGVVLLTKEKEVMFNGVGNDANMVGMQNVAGEILASMKAIEWAYDNGYRSIVIHYDYQGIEAWANNNWKANKEATQAYVRFVFDYRQKMDIGFVKVKAHSGDKYNELADEWAGKAFEDNMEQISKSINKVLSNEDEALCEDFTDEEYEKNEERALILKEILLEEDTPLKSEVYFQYGGFRITDKKLKKFVKEVCKYDKHYQKLINNTTVLLNIEREMLFWKVKTVEGINYDYELSLKKYLAN